VLLADIDAAAVERAAIRLADEGARVKVAEVDMTDAAAVESLFEDAQHILPSLHGLVNNVGVFPWATVIDMTDEQWHHVIETDLTSAFYGARAFARRIDPARGGSIVNIGSTESLRGRRRLAHYTAAKYGMHGLNQTLAIELGELNVRVNLVAPGLVATESTAGIARLSDADECALLPGGRFGLPDDVARAVLYLVSDLSQYVTGASLVVDGGELAG
jgi:NAD(P)-dependent dehydrogenase (short-subunit alcohol dehydrogenase family)